MEKAKVSRLEEYRTHEDIDCRRPSYAEIDLDAYTDNFREIKRLAGPDVSIMAVVKANAYGHGLVRIARQAEKLGADMLGVAFIEEGETLLKEGFSVPLVVLYPDATERAARHVRSGLIGTVDSPEYLEALNEASLAIDVKTGVFIKAETGMGRYGATAEKLEMLISLADALPGIKLIGITTNLADSSNGDQTFTNSQFDKFSEVINRTQAADSIYLSIENSSGLLFHHEKRFNLIRVGLLLYGYTPKPVPQYAFKPVMSLKSRIISVKEWPKGHPVGYGGKFVSDREMIIATVGVGYADGYPWALSNKSDVLIYGKRARVVGRVCMDALMIDVTDMPNVHTGDEVVLLGKSGDEEITADELGELAGSFSYEILSGMSVRLPRIYRGG